MCTEDKLVDNLMHHLKVALEYMYIVRAHLRRALKYARKLHRDDELEYYNMINTIYNYIQSVKKYLKKFVERDCDE